MLRALEPQDVDYLYRTENDPDFALFGDQHPPYSRFLLNNYIEQAHQSIYQAQQLRLVIHHKMANTAIGLIDLFDFDNTLSGIRPNAILLTAKFFSTNLTYSS